MTTIIKNITYGQIQQFFKLMKTDLATYQGISISNAFITIESEEISIFDISGELLEQDTNFSTLSIVAQNQSGETLIVKIERSLESGAYLVTEPKSCFLTCEELRIIDVLAGGRQLLISHFRN